MTTAHQYQPTYNSPQQRPPSEGVFITDEIAQQTALAALPRYEVTVARSNEHLAPETGDNGVFLQRSVRYSDGAVRLVTIGLPDSPITSCPIVATDAWYTGASGFNRYEIKQAVAAGFPVIWNHHQGRHAILPNSVDHVRTVAKSLANKSLSKSAAQDHALLDHLQTDFNFDFNTDRVIRKGYSRGAMSGEAFIAQCAFAGTKREVIWSDLEGACFARRVGYVAFSQGFVKQLPAELKTLTEIRRDLQRHDYGNALSLAKPTIDDYLGTVDPNMLNQAHELSWLRLLICGDAGRHAEAIPLDAKGVRTNYESDYSGQQANWRRIHAARIGIVLLSEPGAHLAGATRRMLIKKQARLHRLGDYLFDHDDNSDNLTAEAVLPTRL